MQIVDEDLAEVMTVEDFKVQVEAGVFTKDDGVGYPCKEEPMTGHHEDGLVYNEDTSVFIDTLDDIPQWATHIAWYNK